MFNPGDKVQCIDDDDGTCINMNYSMIKGNIYTIRNLNDTFLYFEEQETGGGWYHYRFELIQPYDIQPIDFKIEIVWDYKKPEIDYLAITRSCF